MRTAVAVLAFVFTAVMPVSPAGAISTPVRAAGVLSVDYTLKDHNFDYAGSLRLDPEGAFVIGTTTFIGRLSFVVSPECKFCGPDAVLQPPINGSRGAGKVVFYQHSDLPPGMYCQQPPKNGVNVNCDDFVTQEALPSYPFFYLAFETLCTGSYTWQQPALTLGIHCQVHRPQPSNASGAFSFTSRVLLTRAPDDVFNPTVLKGTTIFTAT